jgi:hypothetical protein
MTPFQELARAAMLPAWPANSDATLIGAACGLYPAHYVARLRSGPVAHLLRSPQPLPIGELGPGACDNPALAIERRRAERLR